MFPIFSPTGDIVGFGGRTLGEDLAKYVNSSDSPVFHKGRILYGLHETGKFIRAQDEAIVVEGYMDAIALYTAGIKNVVAILGTAFTPDHAKLLKRYTLNVKMLLDGDEAGILGAERSLPILLEAGLMAKGYVLPEKMDPDDFVKAHGPDQLRTEIGRAPELFTLLLTRRWLKDYKGSPSDKVRVVEEAASALRPAMAQRQNPQLIDLYLMEMAQQLDVEAGWVRRAVMQSIQTEQARQAKMAPKVSVEASVSPNPPGALPASDDKVSVKGAPRDEAFVLSLLVHNENLMRELQDEGP
jgi:DNA primase